MLIKYNFAIVKKQIMNSRILKPFILFIFSLFCCSIYGQDVSVKVDQPKAILQLLEFKKDLKTIEIYKIQVFQSNDPLEAQKAKSEFLNAYNQWPVSLEFNTPNYKIWVGNFRDRLEADRALLRIKRKYMNAFIFQPKKD